MSNLKYEWLDLPVGPQPTPDWARGLEIYWADGYGNLPEFKIKTNCDAKKWPGQAWTCEDNSYWRARSEDGRFLQHAHSGRLTWNDERAAWVSTPDEGYGGHHWEILMQDGLTVTRSGKERSNRYDAWTEWEQTITFEGDRRKVILVGPWAVGGLADYIGVAFYDASRDDPYYRPGKYWRPWHQRTLTAGLGLHEDVLMRLFARYQPNLRLARTTYSWGGPYIEAVRQDWDEPKAWMLDKRRQAVSA